MKSSSLRIDVLLHSSRFATLLEQPRIATLPNRARSGWRTRLRSAWREGRPPSPPRSARCPATPRFAAVSVQLTRTLSVCPMSACDRLVGRGGGPGDVRRRPPDPLVTERAEPVGVTDAGRVRGQRLPHLRRAGDGRQACRLVVGTRLQQLHCDGVPGGPAQAGTRSNFYWRRLCRRRRRRRTPCRPRPGSDSRFPSQCPYRIRVPVELGDRTKRVTIS